MNRLTFSELLLDSRFKLIYGEKLEITIIEGYYIGDLLSFVMGKAKKGQLWLTVQTHPNVVAIANLLELSGVLVVEDVQIPQETIQLAKENGVTLIQTESNAVEVIQSLLSLN